MAQDPVLQREMFNTRGRSAKGSGITSMVDDGSSGMTREERLQMAKDMLAEAQMKQTPEYYFNTLAASDRPAMTRPVASSAPPPVMQQVPAMQQMAQMQAAGIRPVGMAHGGEVRRGFYAGGINTVDPRMKAVNLADLPALGAVESSDNPSPATALGEEPSKWTDAEIEGYVADTTDSSDTSEVTRKIRTLKNTRDQSRVNESVIQQREMDAPTEFTITPKIPMSDKEKAAIRRKTESVDTPSFQPVPLSFPGRDDRLEADPTTDPTKIAAGRLQMAEQGIAAARPTFEPPSGGLNLNQLVNSEAEKESVQFAKDREAKGIASLRNMESGLALGRSISDAGGEVPLIVNQGVAERKAARIPEDPTMQGKVTIPGIPGAAAAIGGGAGGPAAAGGPAVAQEPAKYAATTTLESIKSERAKEREDNFNMALIQAGLAMMGGKSPNALANIGEGGIQGIKQFAEQEREATRGYREDVRGIREEERLGRAEKRAGDEMAQRERMQTQSLAATRDLTLAQMASTEATNRANREMQQGQYKTTEERLNKALAADIGTTAANLKISVENLQLARDKNAQDVNQFTQTLELKKEEYAKDLAVAAAKQDEQLLTNLHKNISDDLQSIQNNKTRLLGNATAGMMDPDSYNAAMQQFDNQESALRGQLMSLRSNMSDRLKISLPTPDLASAGTGTIDFNTLKK